MKFTLNWLKEHLETTASAAQIVEGLNRIGLVVDHFQDLKETLGAFRVVEIVSAEQHPNADRLKVCQVNTGDEVLQVVCGAPNARAGLKSVLGKPGMYVPGLDVTLTKAKIRGVESFGMMCSITELGLGEDRSGIIEVAASVAVGTPYVEVIGRDDPFIEIEVTPNRGDCLGVYGIARDLAATGLGTLKPLKVPTIQAQSSATIQVKNGLEAAQQKACPLFLGRVIRGVKNQPSPAWLEARLKSIGLKSISALVDVTNFMAYHLNRPMHVFDLNKLSGDLTVRFARDGEQILGLDERTHTLDPSMLVIADQKGPCGIAGIMGGQLSGCGLETVDVLLESAYFEPDTIALTGRKLNIISDSRYRFERGVDPALVPVGLDMATQMILDLCGGQPSEVIGYGQDWQRPTKELLWDAQKVWTLGSVKLEPERAEQILEKLGFQFKTTASGKSAQVPSWRTDMEGPADLVEEVIRVHGYDQITEEPLPVRPPAQTDEAHSLENQVRDALTQRGLMECQTWSFLSQADAALFGAVSPQLTLLNPISQDLNVMRSSLLPHLIKGAVRNQGRGLEGGSFFEIGQQYALTHPHWEQKVVAGLRFGTHTTRHWLMQDRPVDVYDIKEDAAAVWNLCEGVGEAWTIDQTQTQPWYHPGRSGALYWGKRLMGYLGELHPQILKQYDARGPMVAFELILAEDLRPAALKRAPLTFSNFQTVRRDFAFVLPRDVPAQKVVAAIRQADPLVTTVRIFDVYQGPHVAADKKSMAVSVDLEPQDRTLTDAEIKSVAERIIAAVATHVQGVLRA